MIQVSNRWFRLVLSAVLIFSVTLPMYKKETSDFSLLESGIEDITKKLSNDTWAFLSESANTLKRKLFEEDKPVPLTPSERFMDNVRTGWQYGFSSVGAADKVIRDASFNIYHLPSLLTTFLILFVFLEILVIAFYKKIGQSLGIISLLGILSCLYIFGELNSDNEYAVVIGGLTSFAFLQLTLLLMHTFSKPINPGQ